MCACTTYFLIFHVKFSQYFLFFDLTLLFSLHWCVLHGDVSYLKSQFFQKIRLRVVSRILRAMFFFRRQDFCYDHMTSQPLQICFLFIRSRKFSTEVRAWRHFLLLVEQVFCSFAWESLIKGTRVLPRSQKWLPHFEMDSSLLYFSVSL